MTNEATAFHKLIDALKRDLTSLQDEHESLRSRASDMESQRDSMCKLLESKNVSIEVQIQEMNEELDLKRSSIAMLEGKVSYQNSLLKASESEILKKTIEISRLTNEVKDHSDIIASLNSNATGSIKKIETLTEQANDLKKRRDLISELLLDQEMKNKYIDAHTEEMKRDVTVKCLFAILGFAAAVFVTMERKKMLD